MQNIGSVLQDKKFDRAVGKRPINTTYEEAKEFCNYIGVPFENKNIAFVMRQFKAYGKAKVLNTAGFLKDSKMDKNRFFGLLVWRLKNVKKS